MKLYAVIRTILSSHYFTFQNSLYYQNFIEKLMEHHEVLQKFIKINENIVKEAIRFKLINNKNAVLVPK